MSYIRTKDGIYEIESDYLNNKGVRVGYNVVGQEEVVLIENNNIIQADTIAELCDEFHIEYDSFIFPREINYVKYYDFEIAKNNLEDGDTLYGVIHIKGKGLIYVAKMNEDGELVLI